MRIIKSMKLALVLSLFLMVGCDESKKNPTDNSAPMKETGSYQTGPSVIDPASFPKVAPDQISGLPILKSYRVPEKHANEVCKILNDLLNGSKIGNARIAPDGQLLVLAIGSYHKGIEEFIDRFNKNNPDVSPSVEVRYWIVAGKRANAPAKLDEFQSIKPALETIQKKQGNTEFKLLDQVAATSSGQGTRTNIRGAFVEILQELSAYSDGTLIIHPQVSCHAGSIKIQNSLITSGFIDTQIVTRSGEIVILGQLSQEFNKPVFESKKAGDDQVEVVDVYYIITTELKK
jgi:hypothetical protein